MDNIDLDLQSFKSKRSRHGKKTKRVYTPREGENGTAARQKAVAATASSVVSFSVRSFVV